jgi:hypothetical protein
MSMGLLAVQGGLVALVAVSASASSQARTDSQPGPAGLAEASSLFPKIAGWKISDGPTTYTPETLFEYIDGGAESFLQFDFQDLVTATYVNDRVGRGKNRKSPHAPRDSDNTASAQAEVTVDIYRHRDAIRAFGMYTQERPAGTTPLPIGIEAYAGPDYLELVAGSYYVKMVQSGSKQASVLRLFADKVTAGLPGTREAPAVLKCFPERGKRTRAEKLTARDFLGHPFLHDAVAVPYQIGQASSRLFVVEGRDSADVRAMVKRYRALAKSPDPAGDSAGPEGSATVKDPLNGEVVLQWKGRWLWGAVDQPGPEAKALVDELGRRLSVLR